MYFKIRRVIDTIIAGLALFLLSPLLLVLALAIKMDSKGSIIFKQQRIGKGFKTFVEDSNSDRLILC